MFFFFHVQFFLVLVLARIDPKFSSDFQFISDSSHFEIVPIYHLFTRFSDLMSEVLLFNFNWHKQSRVSDLFIREASIRATKIKDLFRIHIYQHE